MIASTSKVCQKTSILLHHSSLHAEPPHILMGAALFMLASTMSSSMSTTQARTAFLVASLAKILDRRQKLSMEMAALRGLRRELATEADRDQSCGQFRMTRPSGEKDDLSSLTSSGGFPDKRSRRINDQAQSINALRITTVSSSPTGIISRNTAS